MKILDPLINLLEEKAEEQNVNKNELLDMLILQAKRKWGYEKATTDKNTMSIESATALIYNLDLSLNTYQELRLNLKEGFTLPSRNNISDYKKTLIPDNVS